MHMPQPFDITEKYWEFSVGVGEGSFLWVWVNCEQRSLKTKHTNFSKRKQIVL